MNFCSEFSKAHKFFRVSIVKKLLKYIQFAKYLFVSYVYDIIASFSYLVTPSFRSINLLLFEIREATKLIKSKKKVSLGRIKFYWKTSVNFVGKNLPQNLPEKRFPHKVFHFFQTNQHRKPSCRNAFNWKNGGFFSLVQSCEGKVCCYFISFTEFQNISKQRKCWNGYIKGMTTLNFSSKYQNIKGIICRCGVICVNCVNRDAVLSKQWLENISMIKWCRCDTSRQSTNWRITWP